VSVHTENTVHKTKVHTHVQNNFAFSSGSQVRDRAEETGLRGFRRQMFQCNCTCDRSATGDVVLMQLPVHHVRSIANFYFFKT